MQYKPGDYEYFLLVATSCYTISPGNRTVYIYNIRLVLTHFFLIIQ